MRVAVLVPIKGFAAAKGRLATVLPADERAALARRMARTVVRAGGAFPVFVVTADDEVADWATAEGASMLRQSRPGLSESVSDAVSGLTVDGYDRVIVAHGDLPHADDLTWVARFPGVTLVPDRRDDGTNVCCVPTGAGFEFSYGPGSFARHAREALRRRCGLRVVRDAKLGWDVDLPDDLPLDLLR